MILNLHDLLDLLEPALSSPLFGAQDCIIDLPEAQFITHHKRPPVMWGR